MAKKMRPLALCAELVCIFLRLLLLVVAAVVVAVVDALT